MFALAASRLDAPLKASRNNWLEAIGTGGETTMSLHSGLWKATAVPLRGNSDKNALA